MENYQLFALGFIGDCGHGQLGRSLCIRVSLEVVVDNLLEVFFDQDVGHHFATEFGKP